MYIHFVISNWVIIEIQIKSGVQIELTDEKNDEMNSTSHQLIQNVSGVNTQCSTKRNFCTYSQETWL